MERDDMKGDLWNTRERDQMAYHLRRARYLGGDEICERVCETAM
jgi:hypothetical protein